MRLFVEAAADLVVYYGGSFSGEHGDGQARAEVLPKLFGDEVVPAIGDLKLLFDPGNRINPEKWFSRTVSTQNFDWAIPRVGNPRPRSPTPMMTATSRTR